MLRCAQAARVYLLGSRDCPLVWEQRETIEPSTILCLFVQIEVRSNMPGSSLKDFQKLAFPHPNHPEVASEQPQNQRRRKIWKNLTQTWSKKDQAWQFFRQYYMMKPFQAKKKQKINRYAPDTPHPAPSTLDLIQVRQNMLPKAVGQTVPQLLSHRRKQALKTGRQTFLAGTKTGTKSAKHLSTARRKNNKEEQRTFISGTAGPQKGQPTSTSYPNTKPLPLQLQWWLVNAWDGPG